VYHELSLVLVLFAMYSLIDMIVACALSKHSLLHSDSAVLSSFGCSCVVIRDKAQRRRIGRKRMICKFQLRHERR